MITTRKSRHGCFQPGTVEILAGRKIEGKSYRTSCLTIQSYTRHWRLCISRHLAARARRGSKVERVTPLGGIEWLLRRGGSHGGGKDELQHRAQRQRSCALCPVSSLILGRTPKYLSLIPTHDHILSDQQRLLHRLQWPRRLQHSEHLVLWQPCLSAAVRRYLDSPLHI